MRRPIWVSLADTSQSDYIHPFAQTPARQWRELQLTDAIESLLGSEPVFAYEFDGVRYDCGSKLGYLKATVQFALKHEEVGREFRQFLDSRPQNQVRKNYFVATTAVPDIGNIETSRLDKNPPQNSFPINAGLK